VGGASVNDLLRVGRHALKLVSPRFCSTGHQAARLLELEEAFVEVAGSWAKRSGISAAALREVGVPASVLKRTGL
jgi:hypothetical protein